MLDSGSLRKIVPGMNTARAVELTPFLLSAMAERQVVSGRQQAAFVAMGAVESGGFTRFVENLNYSPERLCQVWPTRFPNLAAATPFAHNPIKLANYVYANRLGNGPPESGDGWRYRGRGIFQLTGGSNYLMAGKGLGLPLKEQPELVEKIEVGARVATWFWALHGLNAPAEKGDLRTITLAVNGGLTGYEDRLAYYRRACAAFGVAEAA